MALSDWSGKKKLTISNANIDSDLSHFPIPVFLTSAESDIFIELGSDKLKIAVFDSDETTELYVEIEKWDDTAETAVLHVSSSAFTALTASETILYLGYDSTNSDNTTYIGVTGSTSGQSVWDSGFKCVLHMAQDPSGGSGAIKDSTSNGINATSAGSMVAGDLVNGKVNGALDFDGSAQYIYTPDTSDALDITSTITLEAIIKPNIDVEALTTSGFYGIISRQETPDSVDSYAIGINNGGELQFGTAGGNIQGTKNSWAADTDFYIAGTYNSSGLTGDLYVDGSAEVLTTDSYDTMAGGANSLSIGKHRSQAGDYFPGVIDEVRISDIVRSAAWIKATYHALWNNLVTITAYNPDPDPGLEGVIFTLKPKDQSIANKWRTSIQKTMNGKEKRTALFTWPRLIVKGTYQLTSNTNINRLKRNLMRYIDKLWWLPIWPDETTLSSEAASGQKTLAVVDTTNRNFYEGRECIIIDPSDTTSYEYGTIDILASDEITLENNLENTWSAGSLVLPLYGCRIDSTQDILARLQNYQSFDIEAVEAFESDRDFSYSIPSSGAETYEGIDLFLHKFYRPVSYTYNRPYEMLQFLGIGSVYLNYNDGENSMGIKTSLMKTNRADIWEVLDFFNSKMGRLSRFWVPTWSKDIVASSSILSTDTVINTENIEYTTYFLTNEVIGRHIYIQFPDGNYVCRKITDATDTSITLDSQIGAAVSDLSHLLISFLNLSRFDIDEIEVKYQAGQPNIGKFDISFMGLVEESI